MSFKAAVVIALVLAAATATAKPTTSTCSVTATPCDNQWHSPLNQTFAYLGIAPPNLVQLYSYWGTMKGCLSDAAVANHNSSLPLSWAICAESASVWYYGPASILRYVYYNNSKNECLSLLPNPSAPMEVGLGMRKCCHSAGANCTSVASTMQMWLEPPTTKNPYSRIMSQYEVNGVPYCLTRVGADC